MPLRQFKCPDCGNIVESFKKSPKCPEHPAKEMEQLLTAPQTKFQELVDEYKGKLQIKGQEKILKARARAHSRDVDTIDLIEANPKEEAVKNGWIKEDGRVRKAIDDI